MTEQQKKIIPDTLIITINTSIPGHQVIKFSPNMLIPKSDDKNVWFNPLVPLNKSIIDKIPPKMKVSEFFNKGLFTSLMNAHHTRNELTLAEAKYNGTIDNNINIVNLDNTQKLLINKNDYLILDNNSE
jgi:hypothetical protein